jgi:hypothetical protein
MRPYLSLDPLRPTSTTGFYGFAESTMLSVKTQFLSAQPVLRGNSRQSALGTAGPAKTSLPSVGAESSPDTN